MTWSDVPVVPVPEPVSVNVPPSWLAFPGIPGEPTSICRHGLGREPVPAVTVRVAGVDVTLPRELVTTTRKGAPLSAAHYFGSWRRWRG